MQVLREPKCKGLKTNSHNPTGSRYCHNCKHRAQTDIDNNCLCCGLKIPNKKQYTELKTFNKIVNACESSITEWAANPCDPDLNFGWPIRIGIINYFVPVRYLAEFMELPHLECPDKEKIFLENVKKECAVLGRYMHAVK